MRLLIIEDNIQLLNNMKKSFERENFQVDIAATGLEGEEKAIINGYDAILLDLNLPDKDGLEILKYLRSENINTPVLIITARYEVENRMKGLNLGADDYVVKPFELGELHARVHAIVRRYYGRTNPVISVGNLQVSSIERTARYKGQKLNLLPKEFDILEYLAMRYPEIVSSEQLMEHVYDEHLDPFSSVLRVHIARLRKQIIKETGENLFETIRGRGYRLCEK
ncbi:response regulator transcription factor [Breznakia pachnodae]|uniref:DNA-binding response OmpR family regulator n=1 Tax=Breznakia pachnodae TaxID=265178 RepID=A0ABU0E6L6_9FIRM|nr:response regulator transcription factor [Breznakia pachnodae]MDQ0362361.1 DNA-binding response OmpR family regulator [Breznakia pachnodae]